MVSDLVSNHSVRPVNSVITKHYFSMGVFPRSICALSFHNFSRCFKPIHPRLGWKKMACHLERIGEKWKPILVHLYTTAEACKQLNISRSTLYRLISDGEIEPIKIRNCCRFSETSLKKYLDRQLKKAREEKVGF